MDLSPNVGEDDLHAVVDGQLDADRHREVMAYLAVYPDAADRVSAFFRQRVELAALRENLADREPGSELERMERALGRAVRQQRRVRHAVSVGGVAVILLAAASGMWLTMSRDPAGARQAGLPAHEEQVAFTRDLLVGAEPVVTGAGDAAIVWLQAHLAGRSLRQPSLEAFGLRFAGGSALKSTGGPAIRLIYTDEAGRPYILLVGTRESGIEIASSLVPQDHLVVSWQQDPLAFALIAPQGSTKLDEVMRAATEFLDPAPVAADAGPAQGNAAKPLDQAAATHAEAPSTTTRDAPATIPEVSKPL